MTGLDDLDLLIEAASVGGQLAAGVAPALVAARTSHPRLVQVLASGGRRRGARSPNWTEAEDEFLRVNSGRLSEAEIGRALGRTANAVHIHRSKAMHFPGPARDRRWLTLNQIGEGLGVDQHNVARFADNGLLPARLLPGEDGECKVRAVDRVTFLRWLTRPEHWIYFQPERVGGGPYWRGGIDTYDHDFWQTARRLLDHAVERWSDAWWSTGQVAAWHSVPVPAVTNLIDTGRLPALQAVDVSGRGELRRPRWGFWFVRRSEATRPGLVFPHGKGAGRDRPLRPGAEAFAVLGLAVGVSGTNLRYLIDRDRNVEHQVDRLRLSGRFISVIARHDLPVLINPRGELLADWKLAAGRFPRLARAMQRLRAGADLGANDLEWVRGVLRAWTRFYALSPAADHLSASLTTVGARRAAHLRALCDQMESWGLSPFAPMRPMEGPMEITPTERTITVTDFTITLSEADARLAAALDKGFIERLALQIRQMLPGQPDIKQLRRAAAKRAGRKGPGAHANGNGAGAASYKCPHCDRKPFKFAGHLKAHIEKEHAGQVVVGEQPQVPEPAVQ